MPPQTVTTVRRPPLLLLATAALCLPAAAAAAVGDPPPPLGARSAMQRFDKAATPAQFAKAYPRLATWGYFGAEPMAHARGETLPQALRSKSRSWGGTLNVNVDDNYCPGALTPSVAGGALRITAYRLAAADLATCGQGKTWASSYVSSQLSFAQTYGYFEADARLPCDPGRWPAFWLLPVTKTPDNGGRLAEVDVFEHYGGSLTLTSQGRPVVINRVGQPFSTLHAGRNGAETKASNASSQPALSEAQRRAFCAARHTFGVLWTPTEFRFYIDRAETFRTPNPGVSDPHYWVVNMDISPRAGDPDLAPGPSTYVVYGVGAWRLPPSGR